MGIFQSVGQPPNDLEALDSTTTLLVAAATYTGPWKNIDGYKLLVGMTNADQLGTLYIEQSNDGVNVDVISVFAIAIDDPENAGYMVETALTYARLRYLNGAADQGVFRAALNGKVV
jgi:hypothetical protein